MIDKESLDAMKRVCEGATPGPWRNDGGIPQYLNDSKYIDYPEKPYWRDIGFKRGTEVRGIPRVYTHQDAEFIATFNPSKVMELIAEIERLQLIVCNRTSTDQGTNNVPINVTRQGW